MGNFVDDAVNTLLQKGAGGLIDVLKFASSPGTNARVGSFFDDDYGKGPKGDNMAKFQELLGAGLVSDVEKKFNDMFKGLAEDVSKTWGKMDQAAFNFGKQVGLSTTAIEGLRDRLLDLSSISTDGIEGLSAKLNMSVEEMIQLHGKYNSAVERSVQMTNDQIVALSSMSRVVGEDVAVKLTASLDNFGLSATDAGEMLTNMYNTSMKRMLLTILDLLRNIHLRMVLMD